MGIAALRALDQDEPDLGILRPVSIARCHLRMISSEDFLHQSRAVGEFLVCGGNIRRLPAMRRLGASDSPLWINHEVSARVW